MQPNPYEPPTSNQAPPPNWGQPRPNQELEFVLPVNVSPLALVAGYLGFGAVFCLPAPIALGVGILALKDLQKRPDRTGKGRAWFGIVMGAVGTLFLVIGGVARLMQL